MAGLFEWFKENLTPGAVGIYALLATAITAYRKFRPQMTQLANDRERNLLAERAEEMEAMRARIDALEDLLKTERADREAERALDRHRLNNFDQCFNALFMIFETSPEKAADAILAVKEMRARQLEAEALEKGQIQAAKIKRTKGVSE